MLKRWLFHPLPAPVQVQRLAAALGINPIIATLLVQRGITTFDQAKAYFRPSLDHLHDPFRMLHMDKAVQRLVQAMDNQEKILIYGDYDVDGVTSVAMAYGFLKNRHNNLDYYIPDRHVEGYGISTQAIQWAAKAGVNLIVSIDCGIKAITCIQQANEVGIDVIICDHHAPGETLPPAVAILKPKQKNCTYPCKDLSGCGVGFKLLQAFCFTKKIDPTQLYAYLDLVAISIAADIVPITGENRLLAYHGLKQLNTNPRPGLAALMQTAYLKHPLGISQVVFGLAPKINAAGRVAHAHMAVQLLLALDQTTAHGLVAQINENNTLRQSFDKAITQEALDMIVADRPLKNATTTVLFKPKWHKGVVGIVAARCMEAYYRPTIILTAVGGKAVGSARSVVGYNIYEAIVACADLLDQYGGHAYAAGLTMPIDHVGAFCKKFEAVVAGSIDRALLTPPQTIDLHLPFEAIDDKLYNVLKQMAPFGPGNMAPVFITENIMAQRYIILKDKHLKMDLHASNTKQTFQAIGFGMACHEPLLKQGEPFTIAYTLEENHYLDNTSLQLNVKDIRSR